MSDRVLCGMAQERITALLAGAVGQRERLEIESHTDRCARCAVAYRDLVATSVAVERAFAPLRAATVTLSPARVRLAMRIAEPVPTVRFGSAVRRINEIELAAAVTAFAFVGAGSVAPKPVIVDEAVQSDILTPNMHIAAGGDEQHFFRWFRIGRYATQSDFLDPNVSLHSIVDDAPIVTRERAGLVR